jgi:hypothetical protein
MKKPKKFTMAEAKKLAKKIKYDKKLDKYDNIILFPEKLERAKELLKNVKLPE